MISGLRHVLVPAAGILALLAVVAGARHLESARDRMKAPGANVIMISIDTLRADRLGCYGYGRDTSPNLDAFAAESLLFENQMVTMSTTLPSHTSMMTGLYCDSHGSLKNGPRLDPGLGMLAETLKENGYVTGGVVSSFVLNAETGFDQGFDYYSEPVEDQVPADDALSRAFPFLEEREQGRPFFLFFHVYDPHKPYEPPENFRPWGGGRGDLYDGEVLFSDHVVGQLLDFLRVRGLFDESLIIVTSDHGESLDEHGFWGHGKSLYDECLKAPLLVHLPASLGVPPGRVSHQTSTVDFLPTILGVLDLPPQANVEGLHLLGREIGKREFVFARRRHFKDQENPVMREVPDSERFEYGDKYAARSLDWKYLLRTRHDDELYNLADDPGELDNLLGSEKVPAGLEERMRGILEQLLSGGRAAPEDDLEVDDEIQERLRSLGYVN